MRIVLPWPPPLCQKCAKKGWEDCIWIVSIVFGLCWLYLDCTIVFGLYDCIWNVRLYLDCAIVFGLYNCGIWHRGCSITYTPPFAKNNCVDCIWIVQLYLDFTIVFGLYDCIWIVWLYMDCTVAGFGTGGVILPILNLLCQRVAPNRITWIVFVFCGLYLICTIVQ